jgi:hypothetical protein
MERLPYSLQCLCSENVLHYFYEILHSEEEISLLVHQEFCKEVRNKGHTDALVVSTSGVIYFHSSSLNFTSSQTTKQLLMQTYEYHAGTLQAHSNYIAGVKANVY